MGKDMFSETTGLSSPHRSLPMSLLRAREAVMERFRPLLKAHDFTEQQWRVLRILNEAEELDATKLAGRANILMPSLTRILKLLLARGLVETRGDPRDRRRVLARLTARGQEAIRLMTPPSQEIYAGIEAEFGSARLTALLDELEALIAAVSGPEEPPGS